MLSSHKGHANFKHKTYLHRRPCLPSYTIYFNDWSLLTCRLVWERETNTESIVLNVLRLLTKTLVIITKGILKKKLYTTTHFGINVQGMQYVLAFY